MPDSGIAVQVGFLHLRARLGFCSTPGGLPHVVFEDCGIGASQ